MSTAICNGVQIDYALVGEGPPVILLCGTGQPADLWFAQVADLTAAGRTVVTFDNRGCGRSEAPPAPYTIADMATDTAGLIDHLGIAPCDVIGYSLGGNIAQQLALAHPELLRRLVLLGGLGRATEFVLARCRAAVDLARALDPLPETFDVFDLLLSLHSVTDLQNEDDAVKITIGLVEGAPEWRNPGRLGQYEAELAWFDSGRATTGVDRITTPALAVAFEHDIWFPPIVVAEAAARMPDCRYTELGGVGHGAPFFAPDRVNPIVLDFLA